MIRISTAARLSIGLVSLTIGILFGAEMLGLIPNPEKSIRRERASICEALAVYSSMAAQRDDMEMITTASRLIVDRNPAIHSAAVRGPDGMVMMQAGEHHLHWQGAPEKDSSPTHVRVPIFGRDEELWGTVEVAFEAAKKEGIYWLWAKPFVKLIAFVILAGLVMYRLFLGRTLRHLDPTSVVPPRVKAALDALAEGIILMDDKERIVHTNAAFAEKMGRSPASLLGVRPSELEWTLPKSTEAPEEYPWFEALNEGKSQTGTQLGLLVESDKWQTYVVNSTPIQDHDGKCRGALATFDDVTEIEEKNEQLEVMLTKLRASEIEIRQKNEELEELATRDPLTGCLNRRSFFELFDAALEAAKRYKHDLGCIMFDIDHFKSVNDNHGHAAGDMVLKGVADVVRGLARGSDIFCRYGGEEFCVILPHIGLEGAVKAAERYRKGIEDHGFNGIPVTSSFGVSSTEAGTVVATELLDQADQCLYAAKEGGRNRVVDTANIDSVGEADSAEEPIPPAAEAAEEAKVVRIDAPPIQDAKPTKEPASQPAVSGDNLDALRIVGEALKQGSRESESMGLHASSHGEDDLSVRIDQNGDWGDDGKADKENRPDPKSIKEAAGILTKPQ